MKKTSFIILLFIGLFITSCKDENAPKIHSKKGTTLNEVIKNELASGIRNDTIFLGFRFGMTEREFKSKWKELLKEGKLYFDKSGGNMLTYDLTVSKNNTFKCTFSPEYYDGKLSQLGVSVLPKDKYSTVKLTTLQVYMFFMRKYSIPTVEQGMKLVEDCKEYTWINGNRQIKLMCGYTDTRIFYEDLSIKEAKEQKEDSKTRQKLNSSKQDI